MAPRRETVLFLVALAVLLGGLLRESLFSGKVLSSADNLFASASFAEFGGERYEPRNRLLMDPVLQFQPWLEFNRTMLRSGRLPLWNPYSGCGAPHLANGQSAVFDPFHLIAYLGPLPQVLAWMSFARLMTAGLGMYLLARSWGMKVWGRWLAGLSFPLCGFLVLWLMYPVTNVAIWMPWLFLMTDRALDRSGLRSIAGLSAVVACVVLGGHVQTSAHVLIAAGLYFLWRLARAHPRLGIARGLIGWSLGIALGLSIAAIEIVPLACYLTRSPAWSDRDAERPSILAIKPPRVLDAVCTALPYAYGSQRRGHPNLARSLGVHNLNEAAGGFAGLVSLVWLAPAAWRARRKEPRIAFLVALGLVGAAAAFEVPPVANLLRLVPVLKVTDNRRLTLWVAFATVLLAGYGIDRLPRSLRGRGWSFWSRSWFVLALGTLAAALGLIAVKPQLERRALAHYARAAAETPGADPSIYRERALRQTSQATTFLPRYYALAAAHLIALAALAEVLRRSRRFRRPARIVVIAILLIDLVGFAYGLNPAIPPGEDRPESQVIAYLKRVAPPPLRIVSVGAELPPNTLMRYGLADARNYDSVELARNLEDFALLYEPDPERPVHTSRRPITWAGILRARKHLERAGVAVVVGASAPPPGKFMRVERVGAAYMAHLHPHVETSGLRLPGEIRIDLTGGIGHIRGVFETYDPGWTAEIDGRPASVQPHLGAYLAVAVPPGARRLVLRYDPIEVKLAGSISLAALMVLLAMILGGETSGKTRPKAWKALETSVRIEPVTIELPLLRSRPSSADLSSSALPTTEGRDADGPLHV